MCLRNKLSERFQSHKVTFFDPIKSLTHIFFFFRFPKGSHLKKITFLADMSAKALKFFFLHVQILVFFKTEVSDIFKFFPHNKNKGFALPPTPPYRFFFTALLKQDKLVGQRLLHIYAGFNICYLKLLFPLYIFCQIKEKALPCRDKE